VTPSLNQGAFLEETIRSVLLQGYPDLEYVIVDGGSTDESVEILRKYGSFLTFWVSEPDKGQAAAVNKGLEHMPASEIVAYLNSDDVYLPGTVARAVRAFQEHPQAGFLYGDCYCTNAEGRVLSRYSGKPFDLALHVQECLVPQPASFIRRSALEQAGFFDEDVPHCLDYDLWFRLGLIFPAVYVPELWALYRLHPKSKTVSRGPELVADIARIRERFFLHPGLPPSLRRLGDRTVARTHGWASALHWVVGDVPTSRFHFNEAMSRFPGLLDDDGFHQKILASWFQTQASDLIQVASDFFQVIVSSAPVSRTAVRRSSARAFAALAATGCRGKKLRLRAAVQAVLNDGRWIWKRHILLALVESWIGNTGWEYLRRIKRLLTSGRAHVC
jgi:glycosyltransferase involved in cell wall biosynthesis